MTRPLPLALLLLAGCRTEAPPDALVLLSPR